MNAHNHGPEDGLGLACPERHVNGTQVGVCVLISGASILAAAGIGNDSRKNVPLCRQCRIRTATPCRYCGDDFDAFLRMFNTGREAGYAQGVQDAYFETYADNVKAAQ